VRVQEDVPLAPLTTLGVGGRAMRLLDVEGVGELADALATTAGPVLVLGGGSNLVIRDDGWCGTVVRLALHELDAADDVVTAGAGVIWDGFVAAMVQQGRAGVECLAGIPGLVGATPMQNVGAYGQEVADSIVDVTAYDRDTARFVRIAAADCGFAYRDSRFRGSARWVITAVRFRLPRAEQSAPIRYAELATALGVSPGACAPLARVRETVLALRRRKGMVLDPADPDTRSAGSFFTNPIVAAELAVRLPDAAPRWPQPDGRVKLAAAWLIEHAGFARGMQRGEVGISTKHALALVTRRGASAAELLAFAHEIQFGVRVSFGVDLAMEPVIA
jgi:UDP-N-acetylmuramate dehydrogenase